MLAYENAAWGGRRPHQARAGTRQGNAGARQRTALLEREKPACALARRPPISLLMSFAREFPARAASRWRLPSVLARSAPPTGRGLRSSIPSAPTSGAMPSGVAVTRCGPGEPRTKAGGRPLLLHIAPPSSPRIASGEAHLFESPTATAA